MYESKKEIDKKNKKLQDKDEHHVGSRQKTLPSRNKHTHKISSVIPWKKKKITWCPVVQNQTHNNNVSPARGRGNSAAWRCVKAKGTRGFRSVYWVKARLRVVALVASARDVVEIRVVLLHIVLHGRLFAIPHFCQPTTCLKLPASDTCMVATGVQGHCLQNRI